MMTDQSYTTDVIAVNNGKNGKPVWLIIKNHVYDVTSFLSEHPGGEDLILDYAGKNATKAFHEAGHSSDAIKSLNKYKIGIVAMESPPPFPQSDMCLNKKKIESQQSCENTKENKSEKKRRFKLFFCS